MSQLTRKVLYSGVLPVYLGHKPSLLKDLGPVLQRVDINRNLFSIDINRNYVRDRRLQTCDWLEDLWWFGSIVTLYKTGPVSDISTQKVACYAY